MQRVKLKSRATADACKGPSPVFFDPEGRGDVLVPTCYAMWRCPNILDKLYTYSEVSPKVSLEFAGHLMCEAEVPHGHLIRGILASLCTVLRLPPVETSLEACMSLTSQGETRHFEGSFKDFRLSK